MNKINGLENPIMIREENREVHMKIGVDLDGVLTDWHSFVIKYGKEYANKIGRGKIKNEKGYEINDVWDWGVETSEEFWKEYDFFYAEKIPAEEGAKEALKRLKEEGNEIVIITARSYTTQESEIGDKMRKIVKKWLKEYEISYDNIVFSSVDKRENCRKYGIEIMIEDSPHNIKQIATIIPVICFHQPYNEQVQGKNIIRCYNWKDVYQKLTRE